MLQRSFLVVIVVASDSCAASMSVASFPGSCAGEEEREPGTHCSRMRQVPLVTCILLRYTKITVNFCLPPERPHCMVILPVGHIRAILKSKTNRFDGNSLHCFVRGDR